MRGLARSRLRKYQPKTGPPPGSAAAAGPGSSSYDLDAMTFQVGLPYDRVRTPPYVQARYGTRTRVAVRRSPGAAT
jgi:hypothetical protein